MKSGTQKEPKKLIGPSTMDFENSVDLFDRNRQNEFGETFCLACAILESQCDEEWECYINRAETVDYYARVNGEI